MERAKKVSLIAGANKGIGFEVARQIAEAGWTVIAAARNPELGKKAAATLAAQGLDVRFMHLHVRTQESARLAAAEIVRVALVDQPGSDQFLKTGGPLAW